MNIKRAKIVFILVGIMLLTGCAYNMDETSSRSEVSDPMQSQTDVSTVDSPGISYGLEFAPDDISLVGGKLTLSPKLECGETSTNVGLMVFVDGIAQEYSTESDADKQFIKRFDIEAETETTCNLIVDSKIYNDIDNHTINVVSLLAPEFKPTIDTPNFGVYHHMLRVPSIELSNEIVEVSSDESPKVLKADNSVLTKKQKELLGLQEGTSVTSVDLFQNGDALSNTYSKKKSEKGLELTLYAYSTIPIVEDFRIEFFVNHKPASFNDGYEYLDVKMEGEKITELEITLDDVRIGDFVYCIATPLIAGEVPYKSESKMVLDEDSATNDNIPGESKPGESTPSESKTGNSQENNSVPSSIHSNTVTQLTKNVTPVFAIGNSAYFKERYGDAVYKMNSNMEVEKKFEKKCQITVHDDKISAIIADTHTISEGGRVTKNDNPTVTIELLDSNFNTLRSAQVSKLFDKMTVYHAASNIDFDENRIIYVSRNENGADELRCCDWDLKNINTLMTLPNSTENIASDFETIFLTDSFIAFKASGQNQGTSEDFYGICDFKGNYQIYQKNGISNKIQVVENTVMWSDEHVDVAGGSIPSGEVVLYKNGKFEKIQTENPIESQDAFLTGKDEFFTALSDGEILRQYKNGSKSSEIALDTGERSLSIIRAGDKVFANIVKDGQYKLKFWELN